MPTPYTVERGDTLSQIAATNGLTLQQLLTANPGITNPNEIYAGQSINLPGVAQPTPTSATSLQQQFDSIRKAQGLPPSDIDDPRHKYDNRALIESGFTAADVGPDKHLPSQYKAFDHDNRFVDGVDTINSQPQPEQPAGSTPPKTGRQKLMDQIIMDEVSGNIRLNAHPDPLHGDKVPTTGIGTTRLSPGAIAYLTSKNYDPDKVFTIGPGGQAITEADARAMANLAFDENESFLKKTFPGYPQWPEPAQIGIQNQLYQLGSKSFMGFENMVNALNQDKINWGSVADHGFDSRWAKQTPNRAKRVTDLIRSADTWKPPTALSTPPKATTPLPAETTQKAGHYLYPATAICASNMAKDLKPS